MAMLDHADVLRMNESELLQVLEWSGVDQGELKHNVATLQDQYRFEKIIVTLGSEGAISYNGDEFCYQPVFKVEVADTVGSGDAFLASYIYQALRGKSDKSCLEFACAVGALTASKMGGTPQIEYAEIEALIKSV
jgi:fructokinase